MNAKSYKLKHYLFTGLILFVLISCEKEKFYSKYVIEYSGYKKGTEIKILRKYNSQLVLNDNSDTIQKLLNSGFQFNGSYIIIEKNTSTDEEFLDRVRNIGGYTYCY